MGAELKSKNQGLLSERDTPDWSSNFLIKITSPGAMASNGAIRNRLKRDSKVFRPDNTKDRNGSENTADELRQDSRA